MPAAERVLEFASAPAKLSVRHANLIIRREDETDINMPLAEIAVLILAHPQVSATLPVFQGLMESGAAIMVCDGAFLPSGLMLPIRGNLMQTQRMRAQVAASLPTRKRLWRQVVREKVLAQSATLVGIHGEDGGLSRLAAEVRSGDPTNVEGRAAAAYWPLLFRDPEYRRRFEAEDQNVLLNYGYAVLRAAVGRAICAAGLHPSLGLHHHGRTNPWCLADDLMEPYRPLVDAEVSRLVGLYGRTCPLDAEAKNKLIGVLTTRLSCEGATGEQRTVLDCIGRTAVSLTRAFEGTGSKLYFPHGLRSW